MPLFEAVQVPCFFLFSSPAFDIRHTVQYSNSHSRSPYMSRNFCNPNSRTHKITITTRLRSDMQTIKMCGSPQFSFSSPIAYHHLCHTPQERYQSPTKTFFPSAGKVPQSLFLSLPNTGFFRQASYPKTLQASFCNRCTTRGTRLKDTPLGPSALDLESLRIFPFIHVPLAFFVN